MAIQKSIQKKPGNIYDVFVKRMFGRLFVMIDFLLHYADPDFVDAIALRKIQLAPTHYIGKDGDERIADLIFQCPLKDSSGNVMAVIVFEHQSKNLKEIPQKLLKHISAIWDTEKKEGKPLSVPYFIVLRTGKKPLRGPLPRMSDLRPKDRNGKPIGKAVEVEYDLVDLPAWDFRKLVGGPVLKSVLGLLKKMIEGNDEGFSEAFLPLLEITDEEQKIELTKELLQFVAKAFAAHNKRLEATEVNEALKPVFKDKERTMIRTIFEEKYDEGFAVGIVEGKAEGKADIVLTFLRAKFHKIPKRIENAVRSMTDPTALESLATQILHCQSLKEFEKALH